ncbi:radical SAM protein [[Eubacterium] cellulosolvens]
MVMFQRRLRALKKGIHLMEGKNGYDGIRFQFRVEDDLSGVCIIDANRIIYLNAAGVQFARLAALGMSPKKAANALKFIFKAKPKTLRQDYIKFQDRFRSLVFDPPTSEMFLDMKPIDLFKDSLTAPYRMDLAVTYKCDNDCGHCYVDASRKQPKKAELDTGGFKRVIDKAVEVGVPHMIFTGGEPTLRPDLPELMKYANQKGLVTGLNTNGRKLANKKYAKRLVDALLDHVQITLLSPDPKVHNQMVRADAFDETVLGIKNMLALEIPTITNTTLTKKNSKNIEKLVSFLADLGLQRFAVNSIIRSGSGKTYKDALEVAALEKLLKRLRLAAREHEMVMIWYSPTRYCDLNPMALGLGLKRCTAAHLAVCVEPNGDVLPCQSYYHKLGNILKDDWDKIWNHKLAKKLRDNDFAPEECHNCEWWEACAGGCALECIEGAGAACQEMG